ncbi:hypothetical protein EC973_007122 [Apophysomyces ossiformis]|uniref:Uncharacterized protein n=1 Tax=Apophysomyces ossiformis TaxID=679940 RepID=A0A8H7EVF1_9FUNG|nr:hypothetical protein EC973_007122 [Apophysomyces ossiformis]
MYIITLQQKLSKSLDWISSPTRSPLREKPDSVISLPDRVSRSPSKLADPKTPVPLTELKSAILSERNEQVAAKSLFDDKEEIESQRKVNERLEKDLDAAREKTSKLRKQIKENEADIAAKKNELDSLKKTFVLPATVEAAQNRLAKLKEEIADMEDIYAECEVLKAEVEDDEETKSLKTSLERTLLDQQNRIDQLMNDIPALIYEINQRKSKQAEQ